ncbi:MAG: electron transfer flavoprotein subunit beta/FixA family protein [Bacillota bacterium]
MKIITPIKQVPETSNVKMDEETGTMVRDGVESIINPLDLYAIESAIQLKEKYGGEVIAVTMGPPSAQKALKEAIAMGCDDGILLSGREFAGSDTWATAYALSECVKHEIGDFDLIFCGLQATDGDTAQVGPGMASFLDLPLATYVSSVEEVHFAEDTSYSEPDENYITIERLVEEGYEKLKLPIPALLTVVKEISFPRLPTLSGKRKARDVEIPATNTEQIPMEKENLGLKGSPTRVVNIDRPKVTRGGKKVDARDESKMESAVDELFAYMKENDLL